MAFSNIDDLRRAAKRRLPRIFFDYLDGGSYAEATLAANIEDFARWRLQPRVLTDISERQLGARVLGRNHSLPLLLGPIGFAGMMWYRGEILVAQEAERAGIPVCLSSFAVASLEEVAAASRASFCYQLYVLRDRSVCEDMIARAEKAGASALLLTVDTVSATRERDTRNGFRGATRLTAWQALDFVLHPAWCLGMLPGGAPRLRNLDAYGMRRTLLEQASNLARQIDPVLTWSDVTWLRDRWRGKLVLKGIMHPDDARRAVDAGADALVVSNHGGRQLDHAPSSISALPAVAAAVGRRTEIIFDDGVRRGTDVVKALALGANAVALGRAYAYGLAAAGSAGVEQAIALLRSEIDVTLALMGFRSVSELRAAGRDALLWAQPNSHPSSPCS